MIKKKLSNAVILGSSSLSQGNVAITNEKLNQTQDRIELDHRLNYNQITNCILEAPNGIPSYSGNTVTVYELTNFLFPNGRETDNTIKNVNFALASNATGTITGSVASTYYVFVTSDLAIEFIPDHNYFNLTTQPTALNQTTLDGLWYNPQTNIFSFASATASTPSWSAIQGALCAVLYYNGSSITSFQPVYPLSIAKKQDIDGNFLPPLSTNYVVNGVTIQGASSQIYDISSYLPDDSQQYLVSFFIQHNSQASATVYLSGTGTSALINMQARTQVTNIACTTTGFVLIGSNRVLRVNTASLAVNNLIIGINAIRRVGINL